VQWGATRILNFQIMQQNTAVFNGRRVPLEHLNNAFLADYILSIQQTNIHNTKIIFAVLCRT
jgi:hypothetical protein